MGKKTKYIKAKVNPNTDTPKNEARQTQERPEIPGESYEILLTSTHACYRELISFF